jgi:hypothetical protein
VELRGQKFLRAAEEACVRSVRSLGRTSLVSAAPCVPCLLRDVVLRLTMGEIGSLRRGLTCESFMLQGFLTSSLTTG